MQRYTKYCTYLNQNFRYTFFWYNSHHLITKWRRCMNDIITVRRGSVLDKMHTMIINQGILIVNSKLVSSNGFNPTAILIFYYDIAKVGSCLSLEINAFFFFLKKRNIFMIQLLSSQGTFYRGQTSI